VLLGCPDHPAKDPLALKMKERATSRQCLQTKKGGLAAMPLPAPAKRVQNFTSAPLYLDSSCQHLTTRSNHNNHAKLPYATDIATAPHLAPPVSLAPVTVSQRYAWMRGREKRKVYCTSLGHFYMLFSTRFSNDEPTSYIFYVRSTMRVYVWRPLLTC
jgi:hypothetical protein